jgi:ATP-binding cassette subfamily B protein
MNAARWVVPEVIQSSAMDCGPAALKSLFEGFGIRASYGRLREACRTEVDGTSIDTLEDVAVQLGLDAEQQMLPVDHMLEPRSRLPAIVVVRQPSGFSHFVVAWRTHGPIVQIMDPATGRRWITREQFLRSLWVHNMTVPAEQWHAWAQTDDFLGPLRFRIGRLGATPEQCAAVVQEGLARGTWRALAATDAAVRLATALVDARGVQRGAQATALVRHLAERAAGATADDLAWLPSRYWSARPAPGSESDEELSLVRGTLMIRVRGTRAAATAADESRPLASDLAAVLEEPPVRPLRELWRLVGVDGAFAPAVVAGALGLAAAAVLFEALLFRGLFDVGRDLIVTGQRVAGAAALVSFLAIVLLLELWTARALFDMGRRLELRFRFALLTKLPLLEDRYFASRLSSDMAQRAHSTHALRGLPWTAGRILRLAFELLLTGAGLVWLSPASAAIAVTACLAAIAVPMIAHPALVERDLRGRAHLGGLSRFYLDALLGLVAVRSHGAERAVRREHEAMVEEWTKANDELSIAAILAEGAQLTIGFGLAISLVVTHLDHYGAGGAVLAIYWALALPVLGQQLALEMAQLPRQRNVAVRLLEPLGAPEPSEARVAADVAAPAPLGTAVSLRNVGVTLGGHTVLEDLVLDIAPGEHVAVIGPSGAGKSTLAALLLGFHPAAQGELELDGERASAETFAALRRQTAWVDPAVQLWNRSLFENLVYGQDGSSTDGLVALDASGLRPLIQKLPEGLQQPLGESGRLVSGGEGQRVRFGRGTLRADVRLAILDEPFRGLDRTSRRRLLAAARAHWRAATLVWITHDIGDTREFDRVAILDGGRIVETGVPAKLAADPDSRYGRLLAEDETHRRDAWRAGWIRLKLERGRIVEANEEVE